MMTTHLHNKHSQVGFSLIELMIALVIGLLISAALGMLFLNVSRSNDEMAKANSQIETGRFAMQLLQEDIVHGGYWAGHVPRFDDFTFLDVPDDVPTAIPNPCLTYDAANWTPDYVESLIGLPMQVYGATPPSGAGCVTNLATNKKIDTDVLVVRHAETCVPGQTNCDPNVADRLYFQASQCELEQKDNPFLLATSNFALHKRDCVPNAGAVTGTIADIQKFISNIYYVRDYATTVGDGIPTLMVSQFDLVGGVLAHQEAIPLIEGIEGFTVELGIDNRSDTDNPTDYTKEIIWADETRLDSPTNRGDGIPEGAFLHCTDTTPCTVAQLTNVVAAKIYVLARADRVSPGYLDTKTYQLGSTTLGPYNDGFKRHVFSTTVRLNNVSSRRETP